MLVKPVLPHQKVLQAVCPLDVLTVLRQRTKITKKPRVRRVKQRRALLHFLCVRDVYVSSSAVQYTVNVSQESIPAILAENAHSTNTT